MFVYLWLQVLTQGEKEQRSLQSRFLISIRIYFKL